jgi:uncharacterized protein (UPF0216 family)
VCAEHEIALLKRDHTRIPGTDGTNHRLTRQTMDLVRAVDDPGGRG